MQGEGPQGWLGADGYITKRLPVRLYPTVDRDALAASSSAAVEALLENKVDADGDLKPFRIHAMRLNGPTKP